MTTRITNAKGSSSFSIPELTTDPVSPTAGYTWVLKTPAGTPIGLLLAITQSVPTYQLKYRTTESTTKATGLS